MAFRIKHKPRPPKRKTREDYKDINDFSTVADIITYLEAKEIPPEKAVIDWYYGEHQIIRWTYPEPDIEFQARMDTYEKSLKAWNEWYAANKELIDKELEKRAKKELDKKKKEVARRKKDLDRKKEELAKELKELEKLENS